MALEATYLSCIKQDRVLFSGLDLQLGTGEVLYLQGENGSGKTSLLRILAGLSEPAEGQVGWLGENIKENPEPFHSQLIYLGHKLGLNMHLSALDNLAFWQTLHKVGFKQPLMDVLGALRLQGLEDVPVMQLSAGQQRRVGLARLWLKPAKIWILDEPFNALDKWSVAFLLDKIRQHVASGGMVVLTSHLDIGNQLDCKSLTLEYQI